MSLADDFDPSEAAPFYPLSQLEEGSTVELDFLSDARQDNDVQARFVADVMVGDTQYRLGIGSALATALHDLSPLAGKTVLLSWSEVDAPHTEATIREYHAKEAGDDA